MRFEQYLIALAMGSLVLLIGLAVFGSNIVTYNIQNSDTDKFDGTYNNITQIFRGAKRPRERY